MEAWERLQAQDKKEELKEVKFQRLYSCVKLSTPPSSSIDHRVYSVLEKLFEEGWGDELSEHLQSYCGLDEVTGVGISKPLSEKGRTAFEPPRENVCSTPSRVGRNQGSGSRVYGEPQGPAPFSGTTRTSQHPGHRLASPDLRIQTNATPNR